MPTRAPPLTKSGCSKEPGCALRHPVLRRDPRAARRGNHPARAALDVPAALKDMVSTEHLDRLEHCYGQMFVDVARMFARSCPNPPDAIAFPRNEQEVTDALAWCDEIGAVAIPYGGAPAWSPASSRRRRTGS